MAKDQRLRISPLQAISMFLLMPPIAAYVLAKTCVMRLLVGSWRPPAPDEDDPSAWDVICISHVNWEHVWQRNQHTATHLAAKSKVLYLNTIRLDTFAKHLPRHLLQLKKVANDVWHYETFVLPFETLLPVVQRLNRFMLRTRILYHMKQLGFRSSILWFYFPTHCSLVGKLDERAVVYDIQDEYSKFLWAPRDTAEREKQLLARADIVFAGTDALRESKSPLASGEVHFFGCGVDFDHFHNAYNRDKPRDLHKLKNKIQLGYFGLIDERVDSELLAYLAKQRPEWDFVMIGPVEKTIFNMFEAPNVAFVHAKPYSDLPRYLGLWSVCLMPFAINDLTRHINPTKALEYFASGRPVVSTPIPDMVKYYSDVIYFAETPEDFVAQCDACLADFPKERKEQGLQLARERSWESVVGEMRRLIDEVVARRQRG